MADTTLPQRSGLYGELDQLTAEKEAAEVRVAELEAAVDKQEIEAGFTSNGNMWRFWSRKCSEHLAKRKATEARLAEVEADMRMIVSHATMGVTDGQGMSVNDISVEITRARNEVYEGGKRSAPGALTDAKFKPMCAAPKTGDNLIAKSFLAWCPDETAPDGGDWRVCWWEPKVEGGCWWSDRDMREHPVLWTDLPRPGGTP